MHMCLHSILYCFLGTEGILNICPFQKNIQKGLEGFPRDKKDFMQLRNTFRKVYIFHDFWKNSFNIHAPTYSFIFTGLHSISRCFLADEPPGYVKSHSGGPPRAPGAPLSISRIKNEFYAAVQYFTQNG